MNAAALPIVAFNPSGREYQLDPFATYRRLRDEGPVVRTRLGAVVVLGYRAALDVLSNDECCREFGALRRRRFGDGTANSTLEQAQLAMLNLDGEEHRQLRSVFARAFAPRTLTARMKDMHALADQLAAKLDFARGVDVVSAFSTPYAAAIICDIVGLNSTVTPLVLDWVRRCVFLIELSTPTSAELVEADAVTRQLDEVLLSALSSPPPGSLLSELSAAMNRGEISERSALVNAGFALIAGIETTSSLIANTFHGAMSACREGLAALLDRMSFESVFNEAARLYPSIHSTTRVPRTPVRVDGREITAGTPMIVILAAANRDPEFFGPDPDMFDPARNEVPHLSFSKGPHYCLGAALSRMSGKPALQALARATAGTRPATRISFETRTSMRTPAQVFAQW